MNVEGIHLAHENGLWRPTEIVFPNHNQRVSHLALDIGGSLAKVAYFTENKKLNFIKFETACIGECLEFVKSFGTQKILATGGGAHKFQHLFAELGVELVKRDEMDCLVKGMTFFIKHVPMEIFSFLQDLPPEFEPVPPVHAFPYMLVNIGSGVSILKVNSEDCFERISGTSLGGGTFWGLMSLISDGISFEDMLKLSMQGENSNVDMLVGDIYGMDYAKIGLKSSTIASSMGKLFKMKPEERKDVKIQDVARSALYMISNNIGQIAYLNARAHELSRIYFGGHFICGHPETMNTLSYAIRFWSKGTMKAMFLRHEGYVGAVGAFLQE